MIGSPYGMRVEVVTKLWIRNETGLEADDPNFPTGVGEGHPVKFLAANADVGYVDAKHFQAVFQLFQGEVILGQHDGFPCVN